jgi:hypothetical protein
MTPAPTTPTLGKVVGTDMWLLQPSIEKGCEGRFAPGEVLDAAHPDRFATLDFAAQVVEQHAMLRFDSDRRGTKEVGLRVRLAVPDPVGQGDDVHDRCEVVLVVRGPPRV